MNFIKHKYHRVVAFMLAVCMLVLSVPSQAVYASSPSGASESDGIYTSMYDVSTALTAYANNVVGSNTNDKHDDHKLKEMDEKKPGIAGAYVGYGDSDKGFYGYIASNTAKAVTSSSYDAWLNVGDNGSTYAYARYGHLLSDLGLDETGDATGSSMMRSTFGLFMQGTHSVAGFVPTIFEFSLKILRTLNPFRFLIKDDKTTYDESEYGGSANGLFDGGTTSTDGSVESGAGAVDKAITDNAHGENAVDVTASAGALEPVVKVMTSIYSGTRAIGFLSIIPLLLVLLLWSMLMKRDMSGLKSFVIKFAFIATGVPLCAALYTGVLDQTLTAVQTNPAASRLVACTFVDFQSWVQSSRLDLPSGVTLKSVGKSNSSGDSTTAAGAASAETLRSLRDITFRINNAVYQFNGLSTSGIGGFGSTTEQKEAANFNPGMWDNNGHLKDNGSNSTVEKQVNGLLQRYRSGDFYQASAWETSVNSALNKYHASELGATPSTSNANTNDGKVYQMYDETDEATDWMNRTVADNKKIFTGHKWNNFNIFSNGALTTQDSTAGIRVDSTIIYNSGLGSNNWTDDMADPAVKGGLSSISMYNYLSSSFDDASISVYSAQKSTSEYTKKAHYAVNLIGSGALRVAYALNCVACLFSFALIGVMYGLGMVISNLKRGISMLMQIPFAMMGAVRGIIQVVMYVFTMCIELLFTVYVYQFVCEFIVIFASVIETPISNLVKQADGMTESVIFGGRFSFLTNFVSPETLYNNRYLFVLGVFGLMVAVILFTGHVLVKSNAYLSAYEYAVCKWYRLITCKEMLPVFDKWMARRKSLYVWDDVSEINDLVSETVHDLSRSKSDLEKGACHI